MTDSITNLRNKNFRRVVIAFVSLSLALVVGILVLGIVERIRDASDRAT